MNRIFLILATIAVSAVALAKDIQTLVLTTDPPMHCESCENRIKKGLRFEKGVKSIATDIDRQRVTVKFDADKNSRQGIISAFDAIGYEAREIAADSVVTNSK